jgi:citronellol/citronellal dehydrogenase
MSFNGKTVLITGASRGIGKAIALKLASEGANIIIAAKSVEENPKLGGTIYSAAKEVEAAGGKALPLQCDIRNEEDILKTIREATSIFGGIDILVNNASAITLTNTEQTETKRFDLMQDVNVRGTFLVTKHCIPFLRKSENPHILTLSPPLNIKQQWLGAYLAYSLSKFNMTMMAMGWAEELKKYKIASNALWPATTIATAAVKNILGGDMLINMSRKPEILADTAYYILQQDSTTCTGNAFIDEDVLKQHGISDFTSYAINANSKLQKDLFLD